MRFFFSLALLLLMGTAFANDGYAGIDGQGGRMRLMKREHSSIRMEREWVRMDLYPRYNDVSVTFIFVNDDPKTTVTMGFPEQGERGGDGGGGVVFPAENKTAYQRFRTTVDGRAVRAHRHLVAEVPDENYHALWAKRVTFARGQRRTITVSYRAIAGRRDTVYDPNPNKKFVTYQFTGGNWKGKVAQSRLTVVSHLNKGLVGFTPKVPDSKRLTKSSYSRGIWHYTWRNWQAQGDFYLEYKAIDPGYLWLATERRPFTPSTWSVVIRQPGPVDSHPYSSPSVLLRGNTAFIRLYEMNFELSNNPPGFDQDSVATTWDGRKREATLHAGARKIRWQPGKAQMVVDGTTQPLPAAPFLTGADDEGGRRLYVPLRALVEAFNGTIALDMQSRKVTLQFPAAKVEE